MVKQRSCKMLNVLKYQRQIQDVPKREGSRFIRRYDHFVLKHFIVGEKALQKTHNRKTPMHNTLNSLDQSTWKYLITL